VLPGLSFPHHIVGNDGIACCAAKLIINDNLSIPYYKDKLYESYKQDENKNPENSGRKGY
jgi:hypothetical protein